MNEEPQPLPSVVVEPPRALPPMPCKGWTKLSWAVILAFVGGILALRMLPAAGETGAAGVAQRIDLKVMQIQMQCLVAARDIAPTLNAQDQYESVAAAADDDPAKRLRVSVFAADMVGPAEALKQLDAVAQPDRLAPEDAHLLDVLRRLYRDQERGLFFHPSVSGADAHWLQEKLGWLGALALYPAVSETTLERHTAHAGAQGPVLLEQYRNGRQAVLDRATQTLTIVLAVASAVIFVLALGFLGLPIFLLLWMAGVVRVGLKPGVAPAGVYAETFALWLVCYGGLLIGGDLLLHDRVPAVVRGSIAMPLSLLIAFWPVLRGVPWRQVRQDIGWTLGRQAPLEPLCGFACYVINVPVVIVGFLLTVGLAAGYGALQSQAGGGEPAAPTHPILEQLAHPDWLDLLLTFFLASVVAPIVEETMFRGFLHRHLREVCFTRRPLVGGVCTALTVNVLFAAVHPQGPLFIPVLTALACGFSLAREWRGTLIPSMIAHGTNNFLVGMLAFLLLGR